MHSKVFYMLQLYQAPAAHAADQALGRVSWNHHINPGQDVVRSLANTFSLDLKTLQKQLGSSCRPLAMEYQGTTIITLAATRKNQPDAKRLFDMEYLTILVRDEQIVTVGQDSNQSMHQLLESLNQKPEPRSVQTVLFSILKVGAGKFVEALAEINKKVEEVENGLKKSIQNKQIFNLLENNKNLNLLSSTLKSNLNILKKIQIRKSFNSDDASHALLADAIIETEQAQSMAEIHNINLSNLMDAYSAAVENNLSLVVQYLSVYVIVAAVPMGIAGIYGMNTPLPFQDEPYALAALGGIALLVATLLVVTLKVRRII
ncbi:magnesium transporter CorA family protein [Alcaligenes faecalis]|uniref:magnesium transporter CorA family protein n=1 Tax=Alcaligenes faecalis TaxID=511 RepID=UPI001292F664|nr:magnesium transporter CorA family protein [Alcaligenes faecalis]QFY79193.1 magnesium transporter CorA family protein [Alcaligenes faecalis]